MEARIGTDRESRQHHVAETALGGKRQGSQPSPSCEPPTRNVEDWAHQKARNGTDLESRQHHEAEMAMGGKRQGS